MNFPQTDELHVFIPGHSPDYRRAPFGRRLQVRLRTIWTCSRRWSGPAGLQARPRAPAGEVVVYQIGDLFDLWRQVDGLDPNASAASAIQNDHASLLSALRDPDLNAQFLLGNHDYDLYRFPNFDAWQRSYVLAPSVMLLHGDVFDWVEKLPDELQNLALFLLTRTP